MAVGSSTSSIVTVTLQLSEFPLGSVAVRTTLFVPALAQVKESGEADSATEQLSLLPLSTSAATMEALPDASNSTVIS